MKPISLCVIVFFISGSALVQASDWELAKKTDDGITVFRREVPGTDIVAFKGEGDIQASIEQVATVIFDTTRAKEWVMDLESSKLVRWLSPSEYVEYDHVGTPVVMKDRDFVSKVVMESDPKAKSFKFSYKSMEDPTLPATSYIRGDLMNTTFVLTALDNDTKTRVVGDILCDPKGSVPKWIVNYFQKGWPIDTLRALRAQVNKPDVKPDPHVTKLILKN
jgi:hypothetical protein